MRHADVEHAHVYIYFFNIKDRYIIFRPIRNIKCVSYLHFPNYPRCPAFTESGPGQNTAEAL